MIVVDLIRKNIRSIFYASSIVFALYLSISEYLDWGTEKNSIVFFLAAILIYITEFSLIALESHHQPLFYGESKTTKSRFLYRVELIGLPVLSICLIAIQGYLNLQYEIVISLIFAFILFVLIFNHIRDIFADEELKVVQPHYATDLFKIFLVFLIIVNLQTIVTQNLYNLIYAVPIIFSTIFTIGVFIFYKLGLENKKYLAVLFNLSIFLCSIFVLTSLFPVFEIGQFFYGFYFSLLFFVCMSIAQKFLQRTLSKDPILKYTFVIILFTIILAIV